MLSITIIDYDFKNSRLDLPGIQKYELQVQTRTEHKHIRMQFNLCDGMWR